MKTSSGINIFITGGTGFFGRALLRNWINQLNAGLEIPQVHILSRNPHNFILSNPEFQEHQWINFYEGDILKPDTFPNYINFSHILHAATDSTIGPRLNNLDRYIQIVDGTRNVLEFAKKKKIKRLLFTSSGGVYGPQPKEMSEISEDYNGMPDPLKPENAYSVAKRCAEHLCSLYAGENRIEIVIARCFAFIGQDLPLDAHFAIGNFINDAIQNRNIIVKGSGSPIRTYLDQKDLALWLTTLLYKGKSGEAYNVGSNEEISILELAKLVREIVSPSLKIIISNDSIIENFRNRYVPNISKIQQHLGLKPNYNLQQSIMEVVKNHKI